jgi:hypothetical protein
MRLRTTLYTTLALALVLLFELHAATPAITVFKDPTCGCCNLWVEHLRANGFQVTVQEVQNIGDYKRKYGVPDAARSCHTAIVSGYTIEGHVPAAEIHRLLKERPKAKGLAVPGMPLGSPGMEGARSDNYSVLLFDADGHTSVYREYPAH